MDLFFLPFCQVVITIIRKLDGAGLGLAICKGLVELMGGEIRAESVPAKVQHFTLPSKPRSQKTYLLNQRRGPNLSRTYLRNTLK